MRLLFATSSSAQLVMFGEVRAAQESGMPPCS
jgi:hypothetical protein